MVEPTDEGGLYGEPNGKLGRHGILASRLENANRSDSVMVSDADQTVGEQSVQADRDQASSDREFATRDPDDSEASRAFAKSLADRFFVRAELERIFDFRLRATDELLSQASDRAPAFRGADGEPG